MLELLEDRLGRSRQSQAILPPPLAQADIGEDRQSLGAVGPCEFTASEHLLALGCGLVEGAPIAGEHRQVEARGHRRAAVSGADGEVSGDAIVVLGKASVPGALGGDASSVCQGQGEILAPRLPRPSQCLAVVLQGRVEFAGLSSQPAEAALGVGEGERPSVTAGAGHRLGAGLSGLVETPAGDQSLTQLRRQPRHDPRRMRGAVGNGSATLRVGGELSAHPLQTVGLGVVVANG